MKFVQLTCFVVLVICSSAFGRILNDCEIARELVAQGFPRNQINDWVCLVNSESSGNTGVTGGPNSDGSYDYGLFQINGRYWCRLGAPGGDCNANCNSFLDDDISDDSRCAKLIYNRHGFNAWYGWVNKCQGSLPSMDHCFN